MDLPTLKCKLIEQTMHWHANNMQLLESHMSMLITAIAAFQESPNLDDDDLTSVKTHTDSIHDEMLQKRHAIQCDEARNHQCVVQRERRSRSNLLRARDFEFFGDPCGRTTTQEMHECVEDDIFNSIAQKRRSKFR
jgi:hypothetical protein